MSPVSTPPPVAIPAPEAIPGASPRLDGLWEIPLFGLSVVLSAGAMWLLLGEIVPEGESPSVASQDAAQAPAAEPGLLEQARRLAALGQTDLARLRLAELRAARGGGPDASAEERRAADLLEGGILEILGDPASLEAAQALYSGLGADPEGSFLALRVRWKLLQAAPERREITGVLALLAGVRLSGEALGRTPLGDEAAFLEGEILQAAGRIEEAEAAYRRVGGGRPPLRGAALLRIAALYQKRRPPVLSAAHAAVLEGARALGGARRSPWIDLAAEERGIELLAQAWRDADRDEKALEIEGVLQRLSGNPVLHHVHAGEILERRADRLAAAGDAEGARRSARAAAEAYQAPVLEGIPGPWAELLFRSSGAWERAGDVDRVVTALERFATHYADDPRLPRVVYTLARHYRALGLSDRALALFARARPSMREEHGGVHYIPLSLYEEGLSEYLSKREGSRGRASAILGRILDDPGIYPDSQAWRDSLFALAVMDAEEAAQPDGGPAARASALARLSEWLERYPSDPRAPQAHMHLGFLAWAVQDWPAASASFLAASQGVSDPGAAPAAPLLGIARTASVLAAEATYRRAGPAPDRALLLEARALFSEARDLNAGTWRAPWALARMADCARALGHEEDAKGLYAEATWEYQQLGPAAGPPPGGTEGLEALISWRAQAAEWLRRGTP